MEAGASTILAKAYEKNIPGLDAFGDPLDARFGEHTFLSLDAYRVLTAALRSDYIESVPTDMVRSEANNSVNSGYAPGVDQFVVPVIRQGVDGLKGDDVIGWVNTLLDKGVAERNLWQKGSSRSRKKTAGRNLSNLSSVRENQFWLPDCTRGHMTYS